MRKLEHRENKYFAQIYENIYIYVFKVSVCLVQCDDTKAGMFHLLKNIIQKLT